MFWPIFEVPLIPWRLGWMAGYTMGRVLHALLVIAIIVMMI